MADSALRHILILEHLAACRHEVTHEQLLDVVNDNSDEPISERTLQRDLQTLSQLLPLRYQRGYGAGSNSTWHLDLASLPAAANHSFHNDRLAG